MDQQVQEALTGRREGPTVEGGLSCPRGCPRGRAGRYSPSGRRHPRRPDERPETRGPEGPDEKPETRNRPGTGPNEPTGVPTVKVWEGQWYRDWTAKRSVKRNSGKFLLSGETRTGEGLVITGVSTPCNYTINVYENK